MGTHPKTGVAYGWVSHHQQTVPVGPVMKFKLFAGKSREEELLVELYGPNSTPSVAVMAKITTVCLCFSLTGGMGFLAVRVCCSLLFYEDGVYVIFEVYSCDSLAMSPLGVDITSYDLHR